MLLWLLDLKHTCGSLEEELLLSLSPVDNERNLSALCPVKSYWRVSLQEICWSSFLFSIPITGFSFTCRISLSSFLSIFFSCDIRDLKCSSSALRILSCVPRRWDSILFRRRIVKTLFEITEGLSSFGGTQPYDILMFSKMSQIYFQSICL